MAKIKEVRHIDDNGQEFHQRQFLYMCPGCGFEHAFALKEEGKYGHHHFNMDLNNPSTSPSLVADFGGGTKKCHSMNLILNII